MALLMNFSKCLKNKEFYLIKLSRDIKKKKPSFLILQGQHKLDNKTSKNNSRQENYRPDSLIDIITQVLNKWLMHVILLFIKKIIYHDQVGFVPGRQIWFNIRKTTTATQYLQRLKENINDHVISCRNNIWQNS